MKLIEVVFVGGLMGGQRRYTYELDPEVTVWNPTTRKYEIYKLHWPVSPKCKPYGGVPCYVLSGERDPVDYK